MNVRRMATNELRDRLGRVLDEVYWKRAPVIVDKKGEPRGVLISYQDWQEVEKVMRLSAGAASAAPDDTRKDMKERG
jgi:prevent-host-death family protein